MEKIKIEKSIVYMKKITKEINKKFFFHQLCYFFSKSVA